MKVFFIRGLWLSIKESLINNCCFFLNCFNVNVFIQGSIKYKEKAFVILPQSMIFLMLEFFFFLIIQKHSTTRLNIFNGENKNYILIPIIFIAKYYIIIYYELTVVFYSNYSRGPNLIFHI